MTMEDELYDFLYRTVFTAVIALFIFLEIYDYVDPGLITRGNVFSVIVISLGLNALLLLYRKVKIYLIPAVLLVGLIMYFMIDRDDAVMIIESMVFSLVIICVVSFVMFLICDRFIAVNLTVACGAVIYMLVQLFLGFGLHKASPPLIIFYLIAVLTRISRNGLKASGNEPRTRRYITFLLPFMLTFLLFLSIFPKPDRPISWKWVRDIYEFTSEKIEILMHRISVKYGSVTASGSFAISFGVEERMTYDNSGSEKTSLLEVTPDGTVFGSLYLKGEIFNEFRNGEWYNTLDTDKDYSRIDAFETYLGVANNAGVSVNTLVRENTLKIRFLDISSPIVFAPVKINTYSDISVRKKTKYLNEHLLFADNVSYGSEYRVGFLQMNLGNTVFTDYMRTDPGPVDETVFEISKKNLRGDYRDLTPQDLDEYHEYIRKYYTSAPEIRDSVGNWIEEVIKAAREDGENPSDYEKLLALEQALAGFKYNLGTDGLPGYVKTEGDFLNHFILEKREGYCVHYATAFCLLARYLGYPARVVRGYKTEAEYNMTSVINNGCGHAWPEAYFEGRGWIPFEPTPGMASERYGGWAVKAGRIKNEDNYVSNRENTEPPVPEQDVEYEREHIETKVSGILIFSVFAIIVVSLLLLLAARILIGRRRLRKMSEAERYYHEFGRFMLMLGELEFSRKPQETLTEYRERLEAEPENPGIFGECIETHENCLYGGMEPTHKEVLKVGRCKLEAEKLLKKKHGRAFILYRIKMFVLHGM